jgi:eukaryotic-like serine/threonine-protein kinase
MTEREIFLAALEKDDPAERAAYLDQACGADATLRQRVEALLRFHERATNFMDVPVVEQLAGGGGLDFLAPSQKPGSLGRLAHYEILEVVGRGGMGVVFRAFDSKLHRVVAIKALAPQLATSSAARRRFVREARAAAAVSHDHVIAIHTVEDAGPVPYLVMQFIDGPTLQKKLDRTGQLPLKEILRIGLQIAEGLAAAHRQGLVHRDVKPANILLENGVERVKITDFGLARAGDDASLTQSGVVAGTPMYMSPEQADGLPVDFRSDLFSLGSVLYAVCTGRPPFRAPSAMAVLKRVCEETPRPIREINPELPPWLGDLVARLHAKAPADRFASAREVADLLARRLAELQHGGTPAAIVPPPAAQLPAEKPAPAPSGRPRRRWLMTAAVLLALLAGLGLSEATGITNVRGTVLRLFSTEGTSAVGGEEPALSALLNGEQLVITGAGVRGIPLKPGYEMKETKEGTRIRQELVIVTKNGDLSPLKGMPLTHLDCNRGKVSDLSPLKGIPLTYLNCSGTDVSDLTPLQGMPLRDLLCACRQVSDLSPLQGMPLDHLDCAGTRVTDLSPLEGMPLRDLHLFGATQVSNLSPLKGMPLEYLNLGLTTVNDLSPLEDMVTLHALILDSTPVNDLSMLKRLPLKSLMIRHTKVADLTPLKGMPLKQLSLDYQPERDAEVLRSLKGLEQINDMSAAEFCKAQEK